MPSGTWQWYYIYNIVFNLLLYLWLFISPLIRQLSDLRQFHARFHKIHGFFPTLSLVILYVITRSLLLYMVQFFRTHGSAWGVPFIYVDTCILIVDWGLWGLIKRLDSHEQGLQTWRLIILNVTEAIFLYPLTLLLATFIFLAFQNLSGK
jgi:hypothetical protein